MEIQIPSDVVEEILVNLPAKSLLRFKCVDKSCFSLIRNPNFVSKNLLHHRSDHAVMNLGNKLLLLESPDLLNLNLNNVQDLLNLNRNNMQFPRIVGHCDGLICFRTLKNSDLALNLWNPTLRQHKILPQPDILPSPGRFLDVEHDNLGFGYDPKSSDFYIKDDAEVYSLSANSWKRVVHTPADLQYLTIYSHFTSRWTCLGRFCYWLGYRRSNLQFMVITYDMSNEVFRQIWLPEQVTSPLNRYSRLRLFLWKGSIALVVLPRSENRVPVRLIDIWSLEDHNSTLTVKEIHNVDLDWIV